MVVSSFCSVPSYMPVHVGGGWTANEPAAVLSAYSQPPRDTTWHALSRESGAPKQLQLFDIELKPLLSLETSVRCPPIRETPAC